MVATGSQICLICRQLMHTILDYQVPSQPGSCSVFLTTTCLARQTAAVSFLLEQSMVCTTALKDFLLIGMQPNPPNTESVGEGLSAECGQLMQQQLRTLRSFEDSPVDAAMPNGLASWLTRAKTQGQDTR